MKPYYQDGQCTIYHGDCREIAPALNADCVLSDPPYGIAHPTNYKSRGRGGIAACRDYAPVHGDGQQFDPGPWIDRPCLLFGANYFADKLPPSSGWVVWDKERPHDLDQSTCELAWSNFVKGVRIFRHLWNGAICKRKPDLVHPTQKPVELFAWIIQLRWFPAGTILDPFMGSGTTLRAGKDLGRKCIGIEIEEKYCEIAAKRLAQEVLFPAGVA
jgi:DNA modification methylase